jgi:hypothetical protein
MRFVSFSFLLLFGLSIVGCGGESGPTTVESSELENYVADNTDAIARQEELDAAREAEEAEDD